METSKKLIFLQVQEIAKQNVAHTFSITGKKRSLELQARYGAFQVGEHYVQI